MIPSYSSIDSHEGGGESQGILPLNAPGENHFHHDIRDKRPSFISTPIVVIFFAVVSVSMLLIHNIDHKLFKSIDYETKDNFSNLADIRNLTVSSVSNVYGVWQSAEILPYPFLVNAILLEPYKETKIVIADPIIGCNYEWSLIKVDDDVVSSTGTSTNGSIDATLYTVGEYLLMASENCTNTSDLQRQLRQTVWVKYVRRELSTLLHDDRENFLDAFHILWTTNTSAGQALYGDRYKSINYFATIHNDGGGNNVCDEFHGGYGFLNNHMYLSAYLEQSLQLVNPAVALHYMEYGKYFESDKFQDRKFFFCYSQCFLYLLLSAC